MRSASLLVTAVLALAAAPVAAQTVAQHIAAGRAAADNRDPRAALQHFQEALQEDSTNYDANWLAAKALIDIGKQTPDSVKSPERDSLYNLAETYARRAVEADPDSADGHYILAAAIGRASLTKSKKERVRRAAEIRSEALKALEINRDHGGAYHVLGRWNAEIMRLSGLTRFFAKTFLGGAIFSQASWDNAILNMNYAIQVDPKNIYHRLDLAEMLVDVGRYSEAREQLQKVAELPVKDVMDPQYKKDAAALLQRIEGKEDKK